MFIELAGKIINMDKVKIVDFDYSPHMFGMVFDDGTIDILKHDTPWSQMDKEQRKDLHGQKKQIEFVLKRILGGCEHDAGDVFDEWYSWRNDVDYE